MAYNIQEAIAQAAAQSPDMNEAQGGGDFERTLPAAGLVRLRLISYIELGTHAGEYQGKAKQQKKVALQFELSGPKHPPIEAGDKKIPQVMTIMENMSLNEKANFFRLFKRMNHTGEFTHFAQLLGKAFLGTIVHVSKGEGAEKRTYANLRDESGYTIRPAYVEDIETGESKLVVVDEPMSPLKVFLWSFATKDMWDSLFIDGTWDDRKDKDGKVIKAGASKNYYQNMIRAATDFPGSPIAELIFAGGESPDVGEAVTPDRSDDPASGAAADPLANM